MRRVRRAPVLVSVGAGLDSFMVLLPATLPNSVRLLDTGSVLIEAFPADAARFLVAPVHVETFLDPAALLRLGSLFRSERCRP